MKSLDISLRTSDARQYVMDQLQDGNTLAQILLHKMPFDEGRYFALLNPLADENKIYDFQYGGILPENPLEPISFGGKIYPGRKKSHSFLQLAQYLKKIMKSKMCCYFEDLSWSRGDPVAMKHKANTLYYREEPYLFLPSSQFSLERAEELILFANAQWHYMNIVSKEEPGSIQDISDEKLQKIALGTVCIVMGAYDMEGFVVWEKLS